jgi:ankyrin repeat protein
MLKKIILNTSVLFLLLSSQTGCKKANMSQRDKDLLEAVRSGNTTAIIQLLKDGANVNAKDIHEVMPIHIASARGDCNTIELLIKNGAKLTARNNSNDTPLHYAAMSGKIEAAKLLIKKGANVNAKNKMGQNPIYPAAESGNLELVKFLVSKGAKIPIIGYTPLHSAVHGYFLYDNFKHQRKEMIEYFLSHGVDINVKGNSQYGADATILHIAAARADKEVVELLIKKGAQVDTRTKDGTTPLFNAAVGGCKGNAEVLLANGADVNAKNNRNETPLHVAVMEFSIASFSTMQDRIELVKLLIDRGADVNARDNRQYTPLHNAVAWGWFKQSPPDHPECKATYKAIIQALLEKGADPNIKDSSGRTALTLAEGEPEIIELLLKYGAKK